MSLTHWFLIDLKKPSPNGFAFKTYKIFAESLYSNLTLYNFILKFSKLYLSRFSIFSLKSFISLFCLFKFAYRLLLFKNSNIVININNIFFIVLILFLLYFNYKLLYILNKAPDIPLIYDLFDYKYKVKFNILIGEINSIDIEVDGYLKNIHIFSIDNKNMISKTFGTPIFADNFEKNIVSLYEEKFEEWKNHSIKEKEKTSQKELVGLVFKTDYKVNIELLDESVESILSRGKFEITNLKDKNWIKEF